ncbi:MAG: META domain-containing protein [Heliomarina sp.]|uniref:META domain-containing protein n=1 Tax=Heliomarina sp. TaxID=2917556 RepID=UPI004059DE7A
MIGNLVSKALIWLFGALFITVAPSISAEPDMITISGSLEYRERIALPPESTARITLIDASRMDVGATRLALLEIPAGQVPVPFAFSLRRETLGAERMLALRGTIHAPDGALIWTTTETIPVDPALQEVKLGRLLLSQVSGMPEITGREWLVEDIDGKGVIDNARTTLTFDDEGRVYGLGGCNTYTGSYEIDGDKLSLGPVASTRKACVPALGDQEAKFFAALNDVERFEISPTGALILTGPNGHSITAR